MNVNIYSSGKNRIVYRSIGFRENLDITVFLRKPDLSKIGPYELTELDDGFYYFDFDFSMDGLWIGLFYENGEKSQSATFRIGSSNTALVTVIGEK